MTFQLKEENERWQSQMGAPIRAISVPPLPAASTPSNVSPPTPPQPPLQPAPSSDVAEDIRKLAEFKDKGILTEEEFQSKEGGVTRQAAVDDFTAQCHGRAGDFFCCTGNVIANLCRGSGRLKSS
jgi:hypothetical protein